MIKQTCIRRAVGTGLMTLLGFFNIQCGGDVDGTGNVVGDDQNATERAQQELYSAPTSKLWPMRDIPVCWEGGTFDRADYAQYRQDVRMWINDTYGRVTDLKFNPWNRCPANTNGMIVVRMDDLCGAQTSLNAYDPNLPTTVYVSPCYWAGFKLAVIHEFAHALGFDHEVDRPETDNCLADDVTVPGTNYTVYDHDSITNGTYCHFRASLSPWDVVALQRLYGRKPIGSIVSWNNKCLDIDNPAVPTPPSGATRVQVWDCKRNNNQYWTWLGDHVYDPFYHWGVLDIQNANSANGTPAWNWEYNDNAAQKWTFSDVQIVGMGDLCLDVTDGIVATGKTIKLSTCDRSVSTQKWNVVPVGTAEQMVQFKVLGTNHCLTVAGRQSQGTLRPCAADDSNQRFLLSGGGQVVGPNWCLDVQWGNPVVGAAVWGWQCQSLSQQVADAQRWYLRGPMHALGKCLDVDKNNNVVSGSKVQIWSCNGQPQQSWEYHF